MPDISIDPLGAALAAITLIVAGVTFLIRRSTRYGRLRRFENYLRKKKRAYRPGSKATYQHSASHLSTVLGFSEAELLDLSNIKGAKINRIHKAPDKNGMATGHLYEYKD